MQEDLKASRSAVKAAEEAVERERERSRAREQEAFAARYEIVGVQELLEQARERVIVVEQERDAFRMAARNEEVARIAAEGRVPLPRCEEGGEFASPVKRVSVVCSVAAEGEAEELAERVEWEAHRADRALEMVEFLERECRMRCCAGARARREGS